MFHSTALSITLRLRLRQLLRLLRPLQGQPPCVLSALPLILQQFSLLRIVTWVWSESCEIRAGKRTENERTKKKMWQKMLCERYFPMNQSACDQESSTPMKCKSSHQSEASISVSGCPCLTDCFSPTVITFPLLPLHQGCSNTAQLCTVPSLYV